MKFLVIENNLEKVKKLDDIFIDYIFIDLERVGKIERQGHIDSVKSFHSIEDIGPIKRRLINSKILVRVDPINPNSKTQIDEIIKVGADLIMLPFFRTINEVDTFFSLVNGRAKTILLFEHIDAINLLETIHFKYNLENIYFGLNDLSLSLNMNFMFNVLTQNILSSSVKFCKENKINFGIGGIGRYNSGIIPGKYIFREFVKMGASSTIVSRGFYSLFNQDPNLFLSELSHYKEDFISYENNNSLNLDESNLLIIDKFIKEYENRNYNG